MRGEKGERKERSRDRRPGPTPDVRRFERGSSATQRKPVRTLIGAVQKGRRSGVYGQIDLYHQRYAASAGDHLNEMTLSLQGTEKEKGAGWRGACGCSATHLLGSLGTECKPPFSLFIVSFSSFSTVPLEWRRVKACKRGILAVCRGEEMQVRMGNSWPTHWTAGRALEAS